MPISRYRSLIDSWSQTGDVAVLSVDRFNDSVMSKTRYAQAQRNIWAVVSPGYPVRNVYVTANSRGIPIAATGTRLVAPVNDTLLDQFGKKLEFVGSSNSSLNSIFKVVEVTPSELMDKIMFKPTAASRFTNHASISGVYASQLPKSSQLWEGTLMWQVNALPPSEVEYQFSIRVIDSEDQVYGQSDFRSLDAHLWRIGDTVVNHFQMPIATELSENTQLRIQVIMYKFSDGRHIDVIDDAGNIIAPWLFLKQ